MRNKYYKQSKLKKQLLEKREKGVKVLIWKLSSEKKQEVEQLGYRVEPFLYSIKTRTSINVSKIKSTLIRDLHYLKKRGKNYEVRRLNRREKEILDENGIKYYPIKYKIYLR